MKRVLLVAEDQLVSNFHRGRLEASGVAVDTARTHDAARRLAAERRPDLVLVDPVLTGQTAPETIAYLRGELGAIPLWVISRLPHQVAVAVEKAGANRVIGRNGALDGDLAGHLREALALPENAAPAEDHDTWVSSISRAAPEAINALRVTMHDFIKEPRNAVQLYELFRQVHQLSQRVLMLGLEGIGRLTGALEVLVYDLYSMPEQINPSTVRTISQTIDFLVILFEEKNMRRLRNPSSAEVMVVDDEAPARQMISAAMKLVNLKITCAADPEMALSILGDNLFDLIFLDVNLPQGSGFEICTEIRQLEDHRRTPIVFLTGSNTFQNRAQGSLSGGNDFISKPFNLLELGVKALTWIFKGQLSAG